MTAGGAGVLGRPLPVPRRVIGPSRNGTRGMGAALEFEAAVWEAVRE